MAWRTTLGALLVAIVVTTAMLSVIWTPHPAKRQRSQRQFARRFRRAATPTPAFSFATNLNSRDFCYAGSGRSGRRAWWFGLLSGPLVGGIIGVSLGLFSGSLRRAPPNSLIMRLVDIQLSLPGILLASRSRC